MSIDVPLFRRCCFCLPLRRGLITWGYFKLILSSLILFYIATILFIVTIVFNPHIREIVIWLVMVTVLFADIVLHIVFVCGAHMKNVQCLRIYYFYGLTLLVVTSLLALAMVGLIIRGLWDNYDEPYIWKLCISNLTAMFVNLCIQSYILLLVRSEIFKLNNEGNFRFVNNAAEAECNMRLENPAEDTDVSRTDLENVKNMA